MTQQAYILALRSVYLQLPNTHRRFSRSDQHLASILYQRGFSLDLVRSALLLATARRLAHDPAHPLPPGAFSLLLLTCIRRNQAPATSSWLPAIPGTQN